MPLHRYWWAENVYGYSIFKPTKEYIDMYNKIDNKIDIIIDLNGIIVKIKMELKKNLSYIDDTQS